MGDSEWEVSAPCPSRSVPIPAPHSRRGPPFPAPHPDLNPQQEGTPPPPSRTLPSGRGSREPQNPPKKEAAGADPTIYCGPGHRQPRGCVPRTPGGLCGSIPVRGGGPRRVAAGDPRCPSVSRGVPRCPAVSPLPQEHLRIRRLQEVPRGQLQSFPMRAPRRTAHGSRGSHCGAAPSAPGLGPPSKRGVWGPPAEPPPPLGPAVPRAPSSASSPAPAAPAAPAAPGASPPAAAARHRGLRESRGSAGDPGALGTPRGFGSVSP